jgi:GNAT superfamily N-acetyltransferase
MSNKRMQMFIIAGIILFCAPVVGNPDAYILGVDKNDNVLCFVSSSNGELCEAMHFYIENKIEEYNQSVLGELERDYFSIFVKNNADEVVAGVAGGICKKNHVQAGICAVQYFWIDECYKNESVENVLMDALDSYLKTKDCTLIAYPSVWDELNYCNLFLDQCALIAESGAQMAYEDDVVGYVIRNIRCWRNNRDVQEKDYIAMIREQIEEPFFEQIYEQTNGDVLHCNWEIADVLSYDPYAIFIVNREGGVLGGGVGNIIDYENDAQSCRLEGLWVDEEHRGKRFGVAIMLALIQYAKNKGCRRITLGVFEWQAKAFFEKFGFVSMTKTVPQNVESESCVNLIPHYMQKAL